MAKKVPADIDKNIAYTTFPSSEIIHPNPIDITFNIACIIIRIVAVFCGILRAL